MAAESELSCRLFVHPPAELSQRALADLVAGLVSGNLAGTSFAPAVTTPIATWELRKNTDFDPDKITACPDGFLYFRQSWELYAVAATKREECAAQVGRVLEWCWTQGWPAVAACEYEDLLPRNGGFKSPEAFSPGAIARAPSIH